MEKGPIMPVHRRDITTATIDRILSMISEGYWAPGECLPPQRELAKSLQVGMSTLREALQSLQTMGVLEMRHGSGTFVSSRSSAPYEKILDLSMSLGNSDLKMFFEARGILETGFAYQAAKNRTQEQVEQLFKILEDQLSVFESKDNDFYHDLDLEFHGIIAEMANNKFLAEINETLFKVLDKLFRILPLTREGWKLHLAVAEAIRDQLPFDASEAMRTLIEASSARYLPYIKTAMEEKTK